MVLDAEAFNSRNNFKYKFRFSFSGFLERPSLPPNLIPDVVSYKVILRGKAGVGKTSTIAKLVGLQVPTSHSETPG